MIEVHEIKTNIFEVQLTDADATNFIEVNKLTDVIPGEVVTVSLMIGFKPVNNN